MSDKNWNVWDSNSAFQNGLICYFIISSYLTMVEILKIPIFSLWYLKYLKLQLRLFWKVFWETNIWRRYFENTAMWYGKFYQFFGRRGNISWSQKAFGMLDNNWSNMMKYVISVSIFASVWPFRPLKYLHHLIRFKSI